MPDAWFETGTCRTSRTSASSRRPKRLATRMILSARTRAETLPPERPIVVYCSVGVRSSELARALQAVGRTNVFNLDGAIFQWANEGRPLYAGSNVVTTVHRDNRKWGRFLRRDCMPMRLTSSEGAC